MFVDLEYLFFRALEPYQMEISRYNDMNRVWDTSNYHPKLSVSISRSRSFKVTRSRKDQLKILGLGGVIHDFESVFRQEHENNPRALIERPKSDKF